MNNCTFAGRIGRDAETRSTPSGKSVTTFPLAVDQRKGGEKVTLWVDCAIWERRGEALCPHLVKGGHVAVAGEVSVRAYTDKQDESRATLQCTVREVTLLGGARQERQATAQATLHPRPQPVKDAFDDDIPF